MEDKITLGYWGFQGLAQPTRYLLAFLELDWTDKQYTSDDEWKADKESIGFDFPNLPYIVDGSAKITESSALLRYLPIRAKKPQMLGGNETDQVLVQQLLGVLVDCRTPLVEAMWAPKDKFEQTRDENFEKKALPKLTSVEKFLGDKDWLLGYPTIADVYLATVLDIGLAMDASKFKNNQKLVDFHKRFFALPQIKKYRESEKWPKLYTAKSGTWTGPSQ
jgi:glutathione S-transferase